MQNALTDQSYWDAVWQSAEDGRPAVVPHIGYGPISDFLADVFAARLGPGRRFLEVGAGGSAWPAHVAATWRAEAWGIDFSRAGLAMAARAVRPEGAPVRLVEGDLFDHTRLPGAAFHVVYSGGFVEHFPAPQPVMARFAELLAPGGVVVTTVPNLCGFNGWLQRLVDVEIWRRHVVLSTEALDAAHASGGLVPFAPARYVGRVDPGWVNFGRAFERLPPPGRRGLAIAMALLRRAGDWWGARTTPHAGRFWAPAVAGVYRRRDDPTFAA